MNKSSRVFLWAVVTLSFLLTLAYSQSRSDFSINGPIAADEPGTSRNAIYSASAIELEANGYLEEEYFIEGLANRYTRPKNETGAIIDSGHPFRTRLIVRRPRSASSFNGVVIVEWNNVTAGPDKDIDWWMSGDHFVREGYAYIAVSAQWMGIQSIKDWSPERYGSLDVTDGGKVERDDLSFDIFSAAGRAINRIGKPSKPGQVDILGGLQAELVIATGHSLSANRLAAYVNHIHPLGPVYDGFMIHGGGAGIRDDIEVKVFKIMAETDMIWQAAIRQPNTDTFHCWEVAGTSHVDIRFEMEYGKVRNLLLGKPGNDVTPRTPDCDYPAFSRVPFSDTLNTAYEHLQRWVRDNTLPPAAEPLVILQIKPKLVLGRDEQGNALGGIRLASHAVATAKNTGMNPGTYKFCKLYGSHEPFDAATLSERYPSHEVYVEAVKKVAHQNLSDGYILRYAAERTIRDAEKSNIGR